MYAANSISDRRNGIYTHAVGPDDELQNVNMQFSCSLDKILLEIYMFMFKKNSNER